MENVLKTAQENQDKSSEKMVLRHKINIHHQNMIQVIQL